MHLFLDISVNDDSVQTYIQAAKKLSINYTPISAFPNTNQIKCFHWVDDFCFIATTIHRLKISMSSQPVKFLDEYQDEIIDYRLNGFFKSLFFYNNPSNFLQSTAIDNGCPMLNKGADFINAFVNQEIYFEEDMFIKPDNDLKSFAGGVLPKGETIKDFVIKRSYMPNWQNENLLIAKTQKIHSEYRFLVVDGNPITGSLYFKDNKVTTSRVIPDCVWQKAYDYALLFQPDKVFAMDLALLDDEQVKIIEYNCINASGVYDCDMVSFLSYMKDYFE